MSITIKNCYMQNSGGVHTNGVALEFTCRDCRHKWVIENGSIDACEKCGSTNFDFNTMTRSAEGETE